jgi:phenylalanyl-tRNA synthetase beta chain
MYISLDWLNELVDINSLQLDDLIEKLTLSGFEVEEVLKININNKQQIILDISATPNRADSLSIKGIAKEVKALLNKSTYLSNYKEQKYIYEQKLNNIIQTTNLSTDYSTFIMVTVENLTDLTIPKWLTDKLICSQIQPLNNLLDFRNYILVETGYPFEFYDLEKIKTALQSSEFNITLSSINKPINFVGDNFVNYQLDKDILIVKANDFPISIAGLISNEKFAYTSLTKSLLIEGAIFNSKKIRQQSRLLGLRTERSARYEKGLSNSYLIKALLRLFTLLKINNPNLIFKVHTASQIEQLATDSLILKYKNVIELLGPVENRLTNKTEDLSIEQITQYLKRLNFSFNFNDEKYEWLIKIPKDRIHDLEREIDLIEEIGRLHGYNNFSIKLPNVSKVGTEDFSYQVRKKLTNCLLNQGLNELIQYSLVSEKVKTTVSLLNPLSLDYSTLRTSLLPNLIKVVSENIKRGNIGLEGFEYGHIFEFDLKTQYKETEVISGIFGGIKIKNTWNQPGEFLSWFEAKGRIDDLFNKLNIPILWKTVTISKYQTILHPYRTAELWINNEYLGIFGQIHPILGKKENIPLDMFLFEYNISVIQAVLQQRKSPLYESYSNYPKITKDLSFVIDQSISYAHIEKTLFTFGTDYLIGINLLDQYQGQSIPKNCTSLCIQLIFQSSEKTLLNKEVDDIIIKLQSLLQNNYDVIIRN